MAIVFEGRRLMLQADKIALPNIASNTVEELHKT